MAHNRGRTQPERALASALWSQGLRYLTSEAYKAKSGRSLLGNPDLVFPRKRLAVFVDGCFWHGCLECGKSAELSGAFWVSKIDTNRKRDKRVTMGLRDQGWTVLRIPEHDVRTKPALARTIDWLAPLIQAAPQKPAPETRKPSKPIRDFVAQDRPVPTTRRTAISLFSGAGLSDLGYQMAGFQFLVQVEVDRRRAAIGADNFPRSTWIARDVRTSSREIADAYHTATAQRLDLLVATPPCQGMSSSNPSRGKRQTPQANAQEEKNRLILEVIPVARLLKPRIIVAENVRQVLTLEVGYAGTKQKVIDVLRERLSEYEVFSRVVNMADYGIPQVRRRALVVAIHKDEPWLDRVSPHERFPWPSPTHAEQPSNGTKPWVSVQQWFEAMNYEPLDAKSKKLAQGAHPLHFVPAYGQDRYQQVSQIRPYSGRSAYENDTCPSCGSHPIERGRVLCPSCGSLMRNRPYVERTGRPSLIRGFHSSYRRMNPFRPASTITTNSSHVGSDVKIHPWENRVLSILECADLQTVPRFYNWARAKEGRTLYLIRNLVGEALPTYFTYLHGQVLNELLSIPESSPRPSREIDEALASLKKLG